MAVLGDDAVASPSAPSCPCTTIAGMTPGKGFVGGVLLETDAARGRPDTTSGLSESVLGSPKPEEKRWKIFRRSYWSTALWPPKDGGKPRSCCWDQVLFPSSC